MKKLLCALILAIMTTASFAGQTIKFATEATYPPFESINANGQIIGFDVDIANALCSVMNATCSFANQPFDSLIPSLQIGKYDAVMAAMNITPERAKVVAFSESYYTPSGAFVAATSNHYDLNTIATKTIGVQIGTTFQTYLEEKYQNKVNFKTYASIQEAFLDLTAGRIDAVFADTPIVQTWLKEGNNAQTYSIVGQPITNSAYFGSGLGIAVKLGNQTLLNQLNQALSTIKANGTYNQIYTKYFGQPTQTQ